MPGGSALPGTPLPRMAQNGGRPQGAGLTRVPSVFGVPRVPKGRDPGRDGAGAGRGLAALPHPWHVPPSVPSAGAKSGPRAPRATLRDTKRAGERASAAAGRVCHRLAVSPSSPLPYRCRSITGITSSEWRTPKLTPGLRRCGDSGSVKVPVPPALSLSPSPLRVAVPAHLLGVVVAGAGGAGGLVGVAAPRYDAAGGPRHVHVGVHGAVPVGSWGLRGQRGVTRPLEPGTPHPRCPGPQFTAPLAPQTPPDPWHPSP